MKIILLILLFVFSSSPLPAQISTYPFKETFDNIAVPFLPAGWTTTTNKNSGGDFTTTTTSVHSSPNAASSTDATKSQSLISPVFDFGGRFVDTLEFYERRTSTHLARVLIEASINNDTAFGIRISPDSLRFLSGASYVRRAFALPETLSEKTNVRFRIRIVADTNGGSGIYRIDDVRLTVKKKKDLALNSCSLYPTTIKNGDRLTAFVGIKNCALGGNFSGVVRLYDSLMLVSAQNFSQSLKANESSSVALSYANIRWGRHPLTFTLSLNGDEDTTNNSLTAVVNVGQQQRTMLINEFMYAPPAGMPEWIEIVNNSSDTIPVSGWKISDAGVNKSSIAAANRNIPPNLYFIVTTDTIAFKNYYTTSALLFLCQFSALNNSGDAVVLFDYNNNMIDSLTFLPSWGGGGGKSLERIDTAIASTVQFNWNSSKHPGGATPGMINSVTQKPYDVSIIRNSISPQFPVAGNMITILSTIKNIGRQNVSSVNVQLYVDTNKDSILTANELRFQQTLPFVNISDSTILQMNIAPLPQGLHWIVVKISATLDDDTTNNILLTPVVVGIESQSIIITEIMYAPTGDMPEWVEGYNKSSSSININGWKISDNGSVRSAIQNNEPLIPANSYFVITTDTIQFKNSFPEVTHLFQAAIPPLNNTTPDAVVLIDERGATMDSVYYKPTWGGNNGYSLQRFDIFAASTDSANWRSALPSAGIENSIARKDYDVEVKHISSTHESNSVSIKTTIANTGRQSANSLTVKFFHDANHDSAAQIGELIFSFFISNIPPLDSSVATYDWHITARGRQQIIAQIDFSQDERIHDNTAFAMISNNFPSQSLVINEIMYEPQPGNAEFIELLNRSPDTIDIADWKLMDQPGSTGSRSIISLSNVSRLIPPCGFVLISSDSSIFTQFPSLANQNVIIHSSLSLSNSGEDLVLVDLTNMQIDSVHYFPFWHLKNLPALGRSLERINPSLQSNDSRNWSSSVAKNGSSPAQNNSIFIGSIAFASSLALSPNPFSPDHDGFEDFLSINYTLPANSTTLRIRIFDVTGRLIRRLAQSEPSSSSGSILWNGLDDDGNRVRIGMYIILFEALDNFGGVAKTMKDVAVVGRKL